MKRTLPLLGVASMCSPECIGIFSDVSVRRASIRQSCRRIVHTRQTLKTCAEKLGVRRLRVLRREQSMKAEKQKTLFSFGLRAPQIRWIEFEGTWGLTVLADECLLFICSSQETLKLEAVVFFKNLLPTYQATRRYLRENCNLDFSGSRQGPEAGCCEHVNESSSPLNGN